ncbi:MAG: hypothetical protein ACW98D_18280 [Promethearchaeota archaeon]|jgi:hypothetical protein
MAYNRYKYLLRENGRTLYPFPPVKIKERLSDVFRVYNSDKTRLDRISYEVYGDSGWGFLILLANPRYAMEFDIPKGTVLRIPFPLREAVTEFESKLIKFRDKN